MIDDNRNLKKVEQYLDPIALNVSRHEHVMNTQSVIKWMGMY